MLTLLVVLAVAVILFVAAAVATQQSDVLADVDPDTGGSDLPPGRLVADHVDALRFGMALRGYRMDEVDAALERISRELSVRDARIAELEAALTDVVTPMVEEAEATKTAAAKTGAAVAPLTPPFTGPAQEPVAPAEHAEPAAEPPSAPKPSAVPDPPWYIPAPAVVAPVVTTAIPAAPLPDETAVAQEAGADAPEPVRPTEEPSLHAAEPFGAETVDEPDEMDFPEVTPAEWSDLPDATEPPERDTDPG